MLKSKWCMVSYWQERSLPCSVDATEKLATVWMGLKNGHQEIHCGHFKNAHRYHFMIGIYSQGLKLDIWFWKIIFFQCYVYVIPSRKRGSTLITKKMSSYPKGFSKTKKEVFEYCSELISKVSSYFELSQGGNELSQNCKFYIKGSFSVISHCHEPS